MGFSKSLLGLAILLLLVFTPCPVFSAYLEGTDTTDINGFSRDSAFRVSNGTTLINGGLKMICFEERMASSYFHYKFDDIIKAPETFRNSLFSAPLILNSSFIIQRSKDSIYCKFSIVQKLSDNRYVYHFGRNSISNNLLLINSDYDRSIRYKPNNLFRTYKYMVYDSLFWEPPITNNNHLVGYTIYLSKRGTIIDTTLPINMADWDSVAFTKDTKTAFPNIGNRYVNIIALYDEGRSDFLLGWTKFDLAVGIGPDRNNSNSNPIPNRFNIQKVPTGLSFAFNSQLPIAASIYNPSGRQVAKFTNIVNNRLFWTTSENKLISGFYVLRAELPDKSKISQSFLVK